MKDMDVPVGYKKLPNFVLGSSLKTSLPENVYNDMNDLIKWYNNNVGRIHTLELSALFHGRFLKIHPFQDGNGRVARILSNAILINNKYPPLIIRTTLRQKYLHSLQASDRGSSINLMRLFIERYKETFKKFFEVYAKYI